MTQTEFVDRMMAHGLPVSLRYWDFCETMTGIRNAYVRWMTDFSEWERQAIRQVMADEAELN